jgi:O-antigen/teichoic acid export membrane protein
MIPFDSSGAFCPTAGSKELRRLAVRGAATTVSASGLALAAQVVSTLMLARLLSPTDFGVVAMVTTCSFVLASVGVTGFTEAVIQLEEIDHHTTSSKRRSRSDKGSLREAP